MSREVETFYVDDIRIEGARLRPLNPEAVDSLCASIKSVGLRTPITVRMSDADDVGAYPILVAGLHRLEAAKRLGMEQIDAFVSDTADEDRARLWEIAENLHRADLTPLERAEHRAEYLALWEKLAHRAPVSVGGRGLKGGDRQVARELGIDRRTMKREKDIAALPAEARDFAREAGLDKSTRALEAATKAPDSVAFLKTEHARREAERERKELERTTRDHNRVVEITEAERFADWLMERTDLAELPVIISWLEGTRPKEVIAAMRRRAA